MENISGNVYIRKNGPFPKGCVLPGHKHNFDHTTICFYGALRIVALDPSGVRREVTIKSPRPDYDGPSHALIQAGVRHEITGLEDQNIFWCVYSHRNPQGQVVPDYEGFDEAYGTWLTGDR